MFVEQFHHRIFKYNLGESLKKSIGYGFAFYIK